MYNSRNSQGVAGIWYHLDIAQRTYSTLYFLLQITLFLLLQIKLIAKTLHKRLSLCKNNGGPKMIIHSGKYYGVRDEREITELLRYQIIPWAELSPLNSRANPFSLLAVFSQPESSGSENYDVSHILMLSCLKSADTDSKWHL